MTFERHQSSGNGSCNERFYDHVDFTNGSGSRKITLGFSGATTSIDINSKKVFRSDKEIGNYVIDMTKESAYEASDKSVYLFNDTPYDIHFTLGLKKVTVDSHSKTKQLSVNFLDAIIEARITSSAKCASKNILDLFYSKFNTLTIKASLSPSWQLSLNLLDFE